MKRKIICFMLTLCFMLCMPVLLVGCGDTPAPTTVDGVIEKIKTTLPQNYSTTTTRRTFKYVNNRVTDEVTTTLTAVISSNDGNVITTASEVQKDQNNTILSKKQYEYSKGAAFTKTEYLSSKMAVFETSLTEADFNEEYSELLLLENMFDLFKDENAHIENIIENYGSGILHYRKGGYWLGQGKEDFDLNDFDWQNLPDYIIFNMSYDKNYNIRSIYYSKQTYDLDNFSDEDFDVDEIQITFNNTLNDPFDKSEFYATERESVLAAMQMVVDNQPTRYKVDHYISSTLNGSTISHKEDTVAYEKRGDTEYFYEKLTGPDYYLVEKYVKNGNGHIGTLYNSTDKTYSTKTCENDYCITKDTANDDDAHSYKTDLGYSFTAFEHYMKNEALETPIEINYTLDGKCTLTINIIEEGVTTVCVFTIDGTTLKSLNLTATLATGDSYTEKYVFTYGGAEINVDVSDYTEA